MCIVDDTDTESRYKQTQAGRRQLTLAVSECFSSFQQREEGRRNYYQECRNECVGKWEETREREREEELMKVLAATLFFSLKFFPLIIFLPHPCLVHYFLHSLSPHIFMFHSLPFFHSSFSLSSIRRSYSLILILRQVFWSKHFLRDIRRLKVSSFAVFHLFYRSIICSIWVWLTDTSVFRPLFLTQVFLSTALFLDTLN